MLPNEIIYKIAILVSPPALIKLSLCSKNIRRFILNEDRIWRAQCFREWSCAFPFEKSDSECNLFPAATWLKSFILRKLSEKSLYNDSGEEMESSFICEGNYNFFVNDLIFSVGYKSLDVFVGLKPNEDLMAFLPDTGIAYSLQRYPMIGWDSNFVIASEDMLFIFGKKARKKFKASGIKDLIPVDSNSFLGERQSNYYLYKIDEEITEDLFIKDCKLCQVYGTQSRVISVSVNKSSGLSWEYWNIGNGRQEVVYQGQVLSNESKSNFKLGHFIADTGFLFISYYSIESSAKKCSIYVYSFSSNKHKVFKMDETDHKKQVAIFYASKWNSIQANYYLERKGVVLALFSGSSTLESLTLKTVDVPNIGSICITQLSRRLLLASSYSYVGNHSLMTDDIYFFIMLRKKFKTEDIMFDTETGKILWGKNYTYGFKVRRGLSSICSRFYCTRPRKIMDYKSSENFEIGEWLYSVFSNK